MTLFSSMENTWRGYPDSIHLVTFPGKRNSLSTQQLFIPPLQRSPSADLPNSGVRQAYNSSFDPPVSQDSISCPDTPMAEHSLVAYHQTLLGQVEDLRIILRMCPANGSQPLQLPANHLHTTFIIALILSSGQNHIADRKHCFLLLCKAVHILFL